MDPVRRRFCRALPAALALLALPAWGGDASAEIDALIARVALARGVVFIRNGSEHTAAEAAAHLQRKRAAAGSRIHTAEDFIDAVGTRSSITGIAYRVRLPDGRTLDSATWLRGLLREVRGQQAATAH